MAELMERTEAARRVEFQQALEEVRAKVVEYGITERDIFGRQRSPRGKPTGNVAPPKYRNPATGVTWSGQGRTPYWIKGAKDRDGFLIKG